MSNKSIYLEDLLEVAAAVLADTKGQRLLVRGQESLCISV